MRNKKRLGQPIDKDVINETKNVALSMKHSHTVCKDHLAKVNPHAKQAEETCQRITKNQDNESEDISRMLFSINQTNDDIDKTIRAELPGVDSFTKLPMQKKVMCPNM